MAGRGGERFEKRQRERARQERAAAKRARRADRKDGDGEGDTDDGEPGAPKLSEDELLEQVRILNEAHAAGNVDDETFEERKLELFEQLGLT